VAAAQRQNAIEKKKNAQAAGTIAPLGVWRRRSVLVKAQIASVFVIFVPVKQVNLQLARFFFSCKTTNSVSIRDFCASKASKSSTRVSFYLLQKVWEGPLVLWPHLTKKLKKLQKKKALSRLQVSFLSPPQ